MTSWRLAHAIAPSGRETRPPQAHNLEMIAGMTASAVGAVPATILAGARHYVPTALAGFWHHLTRRSVTAARTTGTIPFWYGRGSPAKYMSHLQPIDPCRGVLTNFSLLAVWCG